MAKSQNSKTTSESKGQQKSKNTVGQKGKSGEKKQGVSPKKLWKKLENFIFFSKPTKMKKIVLFLVIVIVGVIIFLLKRLRTKEGLVLPPSSLEDLVNIKTNKRNNFNLYNSGQNYVVNSCNWNIKGTNGNFGTSPKDTAGMVGTNFTFSYPDGLSEGAQIRNEQGYCLDTNRWYPGNDKSIISDSWWWNPKCYSPTNPNKLLQTGQVGFAINNNKQLQFKKGNCLYLGLPNRFGDCKIFQNDPRCKFDIVPSPEISYEKRECSQ